MIIEVAVVHLHLPRLEPVVHGHPVFCVTPSAVDHGPSHSECFNTHRISLDDDVAHGVRSAGRRTFHHAEAHQPVGDLLLVVHVVEIVIDGPFFGFKVRIPRFSGSGSPLELEPELHPVLKKLRGRMRGLIGRVGFRIGSPSDSLIGSWD
jgi:hypothetical protein